MSDLLHALKMLRVSIDDLQDRRMALENCDHAIRAAEALEAALTPSAETKAAYIGEFNFPVVARLGRDEVTRHVAVPWDTVKQIMAAIRAQAAS